jgi:hypothetical protein
MIAVAEAGIEFVVVIVIIVGIVILLSVGSQFKKKVASPLVSANNAHFNLH